MELVSVRMLHLLFGFLWAAGAVVMGFWVTPAATDNGLSGAKVLHGVTVQRKLPVVMAVSGAISMLCGVRLYMLRYDPSWAMSAESIVLLVGALLAVGGWFIGLMAQRPAGAKLGALVDQIGDGQPTPDQAKELDALQQRLARLSRVVAGHLAGAVVLMSFARVAALLG